MYFVIGPLRTGSSLLSRCIDDHPAALGFCESEINRALFSPYLIHLHFLRLMHHGLKPLEIAGLLDRKEQNQVQGVFGWYGKAAKIMQERHGLQSPPAVVGDKSPDFYLQPELVQVLARNHRLLYSVRDPRAIFRSIVKHEGSSDEEKQNRWMSLCNNFETWESMLDQPNVLAVRYEALVSSPEPTMREVYEHIGVEYSGRFLTPFERKFPSRFLWKTAIDWETGISKDFDPARIGTWQTELSPEQIEFVESYPAARRFMDRFDYKPVNA